MMSIVNGYSVNKKFLSNNLSSFGIALAVISNKNKY